MPFGKRQQALIDAYIEDLKAAKVEVNRWWLELVSDARSVHKDERSAYEALKARWPLGPAVHPRFNAVVRKYYLAFDELNRTLFDELAQRSKRPTEFVAHQHDESELQDEEGPISPATLLLEGVANDATRDLEAIVTKYVYLPIGMDEHEWRASSPS